MALLQEIKVPLLAVNDTSLTVVENTFSNGQQVKKGDRIMVLETSKTTYDLESDTDGYIQYLAEVGNDYEVNEIIARIFSTDSEIKTIIPDDTNLPSPNPPNHAASTPATTNWSGETIYSIEAMRLIEDRNINIDRFSGKDFVSKDDVLELLVQKETQPARSSVSAKNKSLPAVDINKVVIERLSSGKKKEIAYLAEVQSTGLTSTVNVSVETEGIFTHINGSLKYLKNSLLPVIIYETGRLLKKYPLLNAYFAGDSLAVYKEVNIGFAINIDRGLKVARIPGTDSKTVGAIEEAIMALSNRYLDDALSLDDLIDVSFTITDLSSEGVAFFRPLINMMNSAILGISAIDEKLQRCILSLTFDHRVTEGKAAAQFLNELKIRLESYQSKELAGHNQGIHCFKCFKSLKEDLTDTGFMRCITPAGKEDFICQACLQGF